VNYLKLSYKNNIVFAF
jgi:hypothetical protein